jgi:hypothetical protein
LLTISDLTEEERQAVEGLVAKLYAKLQAANRTNPGDGDKDDEGDGG